MKSHKTYAVAIVMAFATTAIAQRPAMKIKQMHTAATIDTTLSLSKSLKVDASFAKVSIEPSADGKSHITGKLETMENDEGFAINISDNDEGETTLSVSNGQTTSFAGEIKILIPDGTRTDVQTTSGAIRVKKLNDANIELQSSKGAIDVQKTSGKVDVETKGGIVRLTYVSGKIEVESTTGEIKLENCEGETEIKSDDGPVSIDFHTGDIKIKTAGGTQTLSKISESQMNMESSIGDIAVRQAEGPISIRTKRGNVLLSDVKTNLQIETEKGKVKTEQPITLTSSSDITTTEGSVMLKLVNATDELTYDLASENSKAAMVAGKNHKTKKLKTGKGSITLKVRTRTGGVTIK